MEIPTAGILSGWTVHDMMQGEVVTVPATMSVAALATLLSDLEISGAPVLGASDKVIGVVSQSDIVRAVAERCGPGGFASVSAESSTENNGSPIGEGDVSSFFHRTNGELHRALGALALLPDSPLASMTTADIMMPARFSVRPTTTLAGLARYLVTAKVHRALVMEDDELLGIVTTFDVLHAIAASDPTAE